jgi:hypothetical protein
MTPHAVSLVTPCRLIADIEIYRGDAGEVYVPPTCQSPMTSGRWPNVDGPNRERIRIGGLGVAVPRMLALSRPCTVTSERR